MTRIILRLSGRRALLHVGCVLAAVVISTVCDPVCAATITWGAPTTISGDVDVSTDGTLVAAKNTTSGSPTINGVPFTSLGESDPTFALSSPGIISFSNVAFGSALPPFASLSADYRSLLVGAQVTQTPPTAPPPMTVTISGLSIGRLYQFQWWVNDSRDTGDFDRTTMATAGNSVTLEHNVANIEGGVGQFVLGTFTADAATQAILLQGAGTGPNVGSTQINVLQLRDLVIPEPASALQLGCGIFGLVGYGRHRRRLCAP